MDVSGQPHALTTPRERAPIYPLNGRLYGPCIQYGWFGEERNFLSQPGFEHQIIHPIV